MLRPYLVLTALHTPPRAAFRPNVFRRDRGIRDLAGLDVDLQHLGRPYREVAEQHHLGEGPGVLGEARACGRTALARGDPLGVDALGPRILLRGRVRRDLRLTGLVEEPRILPVDPRDEPAVVPDPELAARVGGPGERVRDLLRPVRVQAAVAPHHLDLRPTALRRERVHDTRHRRRGL